MTLTDIIELKTNLIDRCWDYLILHRLLHTKYLYTFHKMHHEKRIPTWKDAFYASKVENMTSSLGIFIPTLLYKLCIYQLILSILYDQIRGMLRHDKRGECIVGNHHMLHHQYFSYNYGEEWLDSIFGTNL